MTLRIKTVEYGFDRSLSSLASNVARVFTALTVNVPENTSRTIRSAILEFSLSDNQTSTANVTAVTAGAQIDGGAANTVLVTQTIANSGENQSFVFSRDITAHFVTNFTGVSHTVTPTITVTGNATCNASCKLILTYEFEDAAQTTRIKTVKIPIDGNTASLTTTLANLGGTANQIPDLSTFLPEASKVFRNIFFEWTGHTGTTAAVSSALTVAYNGTSLSDTAHGSTLNTDLFFRRIDDITSIINTSATNSLQASTSSTTGKPCPCLCGVLVVTYEYDHSASSTIMNSIQLSAINEFGFTGGTSTNDKSRFTREINIQEPGPITLVQSGILFTFNGAGVVTIDMRVGSQPSRTFGHPSTLRGGGMASMRRLDAGAVGGAGITLDRGFATLVMDWFSTSATANNIGSNMSGLLYLNYTSGKHADGAEAHTHTTAWVIRPHTTGNLVQRLQVVPATTPVIPETDFWITGVGYVITRLSSGTGSGNLGFTIQAEVQSTEAEGAGWRSLYNAIYASDSEAGPSVMFGRSRAQFKRWPQDSDGSRLDIELSRSYRYDVNVNASSFWQTYMLLSTHSISYDIAGTISGSAGGTVSISAYRISDGMRIGTTTRSGNGTFSFKWYDNTEDVFVKAYEGPTLKAISLEQVAGLTFDVNLAAPGGGGGPTDTYYAY